MTTTADPLAGLQPVDPVDQALADAALDDAVATAAVVAGEHAGEVDRDGRFPTEAIDALRDGRALSALVPAGLGGEGASFGAVARACGTLGRRCSATGMVFAMHQIQVSTLVRHAADLPFFADYLTQQAREQRLVGSVTSEVATGGDMGRSSAAIEPSADGQAGLEKQAPTVSYGAYADDLLTTARRGPDADAGDQVLVLTRRDQHQLEPVSSWDPLGMRGTCSPGFVLRACFDPAQVLTTPFSQVSAESMVPVSHLLWAHLWSGIAGDAFDRARAFVRAAAVRSGKPGAAGNRLSGLSSQLSVLQAEVEACLLHFETESAVPGRPGLSTMASTLRYNNLKISASEAAVAICLGALTTTGFMGYKNDTPFSVGRHVRDVLSSPVMVSNDRLHETNANLLLVVKDAR